MFSAHVVNFIKNKCSLDLGKFSCEGHPNFSEHIVTAASCKFYGNVELAMNRGILEILEKFLQILCKVTDGFSQITRKVKEVI